MSRKNFQIEEKEVLRKFVYENKRYINKTLLAEALDLSPAMITYVINGNRKDNYKILESAEKIIKSHIKVQI